MNSWLLFLLKSTLILSLLYSFFRLIMRKETFFKLSRIALLFIVIASVIIPFIYLPQSIHHIVSIKFEPIFQTSSIVEKPVQTNEIPSAIQPSVPASNTIQPLVFSTKTIAIFVYLTGVFISMLLFFFSIGSVFLLIRKSRKTDLNGIHLMIVNDDIPAFSFRRYILISQHDYDTNSEAILTHELSHIRQGHFYDLMLMELVKIIYWFNPLVYRMDSDLKDIHEFQADEHALNSGIDAIKYQLLIIQKCVGQQQFAFANSFNHCQIKNRITMMNKSKTNKAWCWKVATFLPLLALLLMAFGKRSENVPEKIYLPEKIVAPVVFVQKQNQLTDQIIEIKKDGNFIDSKLCSLEEIAKKGQEWNKAGNKWTLLLIEESIPYKRIDEVRETLANAKVYGVTQSTVNSDDVVYFMGDVSELAKFKQGKFDDWFSSQVKKFPEIISKGKETKVRLSYSFIIGKDGKVRDAHIVKESGYPEVDAAFEKILSQIPDWIPAKRDGASVSVYNYSMGGLYFATR
jgi:beta-lactamase regulating signal transducer with metallopeptidase domain/CRISPR/Cas system CMR-associated protein Cmr5 small subunit